MVDTTSPTTSLETGYVNVTGSIGGIKFNDISTKEIVLGESLLTPGLQTAITFQSYIYANHNLAALKKASLQMNLTSKSSGKTMTIDQVVYRVDNRDFTPISVGQTQEFTAHACDQSLLDDAKKLISKSWKCESPDKVVEYILKNCLKVTDYQVDSASPGRDYIAENIHPFKAISEQCNVAVYGKDDPSFLHYMTFENGGKHYFRALGKLVEGSTVKTYIYSETGALGGYDYNRNTQSALSFSFPCDFDLLSDYLNGVDENGTNFNTLTTFDPLTMGMNLIGGQSGFGDCGIGSGNMKQSMTNKGSGQGLGSCPTDVETHLHKRQARMALLEKDKIRLRIIVPWDGSLHVGQNIRFNWFRKDPNERIYGSGDYLIVSMMHNIQFGGFSTTTLDCIDKNSLSSIIGG